MTVFVPSPVNPETRPHVVQALDDTGLEGERRHVSALDFRRRPHVVVEAVDEDAAAAVDERVERGNESPRRVRQMRRRAGVGVAFHRTHAQLDIEDALAAKEQLRPARGVDRATLFQRAVAIGERRVELEDAGQVRAAALLLSFYQEPHAEREVAMERAVRFDGLDTQEQVALVVVHAAREDRAVANGGLVRRCAPEVERHRGLHVVVLDADERALALADLAHDERGRALDSELARGGAGGDQTVAAPARGCIECAGVGRLGRYRAELAELRDESVAVLVDVEVEQVGHAGSMSRASRSGGRRGVDRARRADRRR